MTGSTDRELSESDFKAWFRGMWRGSSDIIQPGLGSTVGQPDVVIRIAGVSVPIELKLGKYDDERDRLKLKKPIRPAQVRWHYMTARDGGFSMFLIAGGTRRSFRVWAVNGSDVRLLNQAREEIKYTFIQIAQEARWPATYLPLSDHFSDTLTDIVKLWRGK